MIEITALTCSTTASISACATNGRKVHLMKTIGRNKMKNSIFCYWHEGNSRGLNSLDLVFYRRNYRSSLPYKREIHHYCLQGSNHQLA